MKRQKILFIDRDGTIVKEPYDEQVDSFRKLEFTERVFQNLSFIQHHTDFLFVMVTNQDGLGTVSFPEDDFWPVHNFIIKALHNEGVIFDDVCIDRHFPNENSSTRKPATGMVSKYMNNPQYDISGSYVIGDRDTDMQFAQNLGCKSLILGRNGITWDSIAEILVAGERSATVCRTTKETDITISMDMNGTGKSTINTGIGFFDHMLEQISRHGMIDLDVKTDGDLYVDEHHTIEDTAIVLGECIDKCLGTKRGIERYGFCLPMDDSLCRVAIDFGGRAWLNWNVEFHREKIGDMPTEMFYHFFKSLSESARMNIDIEARGINEHHKIEGIFKAFARSLRMAIRRDIHNLELPSTKGSL